MCQTYVLRICLQRAICVCIKEADLPVYFSTASLIDNAMWVQLCDIFPDAKFVEWRILANFPFMKFPSVHALLRISSCWKENWLLRRWSFFIHLPKSKGVTCKYVWPRFDWFVQKAFVHESANWFAEVQSLLLNFRLDAGGLYRC